MVDKVILILNCRDKEFDMEIPLDTKIVHIKLAITEAMKYKGIYLTPHFQLESKGLLLKDTSTLFENGIWDGSYLRIV